MTFKIGFWIGYGLSLFTQIIVWSGIIYLLFNSLNQQTRRSTYGRFINILFIPLIFFIIKMSKNVFFFTWHDYQFIWGSCIILLFTAIDLVLKMGLQHKSRIWWEELGKFDYMLIGILAGSMLYASVLMVISFHTGFRIIEVMFPTAWFMFLGCLQTRNECYRQNDGDDSAKRGKESRRFLSFFYKLVTVFSCLITLTIQFINPFSFGLLLFDAIIITVLVIAPLYAKLSKKTKLQQLLLKNVKAGYWLLFLSSVVMNFIYLDKALLVLRAIGGYVDGLPDLV